MSALICGSLAYDTIMVFPDQFKNHILPDKVHILNVSFLVPRMRREFGGCAGNIAYNLKLLGGDPIPMATVGQDFGPYREYFDELGIRLDQVKVIDELFTPQAFITTDLDNNQITAFHPGRDDALLREPREGRAGRRPSASSAPTAAKACCRTRSEFAEAGIPFIFDPGQAMPLFNGAELRALHRAGRLRHRQRLRVEPAAGTHRLEREGRSPQRVKAYITTRGPQGSRDPHRTARPSTSRRRTSAASPTRPAAATRSAPA